MDVALQQAAEQRREFYNVRNVIELGFQYLISMLATTQDQENFSQSRRAF